MIRGVGVGEGLGDGSGDGEGVCANVFSGILLATKPAAPIAGNNFTKDRRLFDVFLLTRFSLSTIAYLAYWFFIGTIVPGPTHCVLPAPYLIFTTFALPKRYTVTMNMLSYSLSGIVGKFSPLSAETTAGTVLLCPATKTV